MKKNTLIFAILFILGIFAIPHSRLRADEDMGGNDPAGDETYQNPKTDTGEEVGTAKEPAPSLNADKPDPGKITDGKADDEDQADDESDEEE